MGVYGITARSHSRKNNLHNRTQRRHSFIPAHHMRLKERIARSSAVEKTSLANFFGPHLVISPHDRLTLQKVQPRTTNQHFEESAVVATRRGEYVDDC